jgi:hypothetical protein
MDPAFVIVSEEQVEGRMGLISMSHSGSKVGGWSMANLLWLRRV